MIISMGVLQKDIDIYRKMLVSSKYIEELKVVDEIIGYLKIDTIALYYRYQMVLKQLENFSYYEATILKRLENERYHNTVKSLSEKHSSRHNVITFSKKRL